MARRLFTVDLEEDESNDDNGVRLGEGVDSAVHGIDSDGRVALLSDLPYDKRLAMMII